MYNIMWCKAVRRDLRSVTYHTHTIKLISTALIVCANEDRHRRIVAIMHSHRCAAIYENLWKICNITKETAATKCHALNAIAVEEEDHCQNDSRYVIKAVLHMLTGLFFAIYYKSSWW